MSEYIITNHNKYREYMKTVTVSKGKWHKKKSRTQRRADRKLRKLRHKIKYNNPIRNYTLYALLLENGNYYIGMTSYRNPTRRYEQHLNGTGAKWTKIHKPISIIETRKVGTMKQSACALMESNMTIEYMNKYGMDKVRGGCFCAIRLSTIKFKYNEYSPVNIIKPANKL